MIERRLFIAPAALLLDRAFGDPPNRYHPVAWMGSAISITWRHRPTMGRALSLAYGAGVVLGGAVGLACLGRLVETGLKRLPAPVGWLAEACLVDTSIAERGLEQAATAVADALRDGDVQRAAQLTSWHLVSRDTATLSSSQLAAATVESVAENTSDGVVGPLLYYVVAGVPAALAYRWINTCDSMLGYRDAAHEWLGKVPARLDDLVNLAPSRLAAALFVVAAWLNRDDVVKSVRVWRRDAHVTASPNAGHPMSAVAGALGVELEKVGHYRLGTGGRPPAAADIGRAVRLMHAAVAVGVGLAAVIGVIRRVRRCV